MSQNFNLSDGFTLVSYKNKHQNRKPTANEQISPKVQPTPDSYGIQNYIRYLISKLPTTMLTHKFCISEG